jgi:hypothetical protein
VERPRIETVVKLFYLSCLDEHLSFAASLKVLSELRSRNYLEEEFRSHWVETLTRWRPKLHSLKPKAWSEQPGAKGFLFPVDFDMTAWVTFVNSAEQSESEAVLLSKIIGFTDEEIAAGLGVTAGTVRHRVGHGLRKLGGLVES